MSTGVVLRDDRLGQILAQAGFFRRMSPAQRDLVASMASIQALSPGHAIYKVGDVAQHFYVLMDGMVRFSLPMGQRQVTAGEIIRRGEVFGWAALIEGAQQRIATASCISACTALAIDGHRLIEEMSKDHSLGYAVMREVSLLVTSTLTAYAAG